MVSKKQEDLLEEPLEGKNLFTKIPQDAKPVISLFDNGAKMVVFQYKQNYYIVKESHCFGYAGKISESLMEKLREMLCIS